MNVQAMQAVIDEIKQRPNNFAMQHFYMHESSAWDNSPVKKHMFSYYNLTNPVNDLVPLSYVVAGEELFSCGTVGCIAGFAFALMNDNKAPNEINYSMQTRHLVKGSIDDSEKNIYELSLISKMAGDFLGLNSCEAGNLFYGGTDSVWSLIYHTDNRYGFEISERDSSWECTQMGEDIEFYYSIDLESISSDAAVDVLERIVSGEIILSDPNHTCYDEDDSFSYHAIYSSN